MKNKSDNSKQKWAALHESLQDLLAGYADNELDEQDILIVEAHLSGCKDCRNDLMRQQALSQRIEIIAPPRVSSVLQKRIESIHLDDLPKQSKNRQHAWTHIFLQFKHWLGQISLQPFFGVSGWAVAAVFVVVMLFPTTWQSPKSNIPMINDALAEYYKMKNVAFPISTKNTNIKAPILWPEARTLATWTTTIAGEPAQVFAVRSGHNIVFQYQINEAVLFRNPVVRQAIADFGKYKQSNEKTEVLALPLTDSGVLVVGPIKSLPAPEKIKF